MGVGELSPGSRAGRQAPSTPTLWALGLRSLEGVASVGVGLVLGKPAHSPC